MTQVAASAPRTIQSPVATVLADVSAAVAVLLLAATAWLLSPDPQASLQPGQIPWQDGSLLHTLVNAESFNGALRGLHGGEAKQWALHAAAVLGLVLLALRTATGRGGLSLAVWWREPGRAAQVLLVAWVAWSAISASWSGDVQLALGQAALYAGAMAWAIGLGGTAERRNLASVLTGLVVVTALTGVLTIWYFHERNPAHRPGFPIGNPNALGTFMVPGTGSARRSGWPPFRVTATVKQRRAQRATRTYT